MNGTKASRLVLETALSYQQDYKQIESGAYREPWDMQLNHRQSSPIQVLTQTGRFIQEAIGTLGRRRRGEQKDKDIWISNDSTTTSMYPDYYRTAFHYQTDGWMSRKSADVYETSTETLFLGRQDAMQRTSLKPLIDLSRKLKSEGRPMRILEVACGTGRFMTFVRDNLPLDTEYTGIDLSPFYLDAARENDQYWRKTRKAEEKRKNNDQGDIPPARFVQAQAESLPFEDESYDAVLCVYLFHEVPRNVRARAAAEMARVVRPGGTVVLTDSIQQGDRPILDQGLANFEKMNEPHYLDYCGDNLPELFERAGLKPKAKAMRSTTKSLSFTKP
jgi:ubiquinone/menaquinone biosynthesis C-methylase UbiE